MKSKNIAIVCFTFPPYKGIGGRRWAKFAKNLQRLGHNVQVVAAEQPLLEKTSEWTRDTVSLKRKPIFIKSGYKDYLGIQPKTFSEKLKYRLAERYSQKHSEGNFYDKSVFWKPFLNKKVEELINNGFDNVIVSCAPFRSAVHLTELKIKYPKVNFVCDFRDPWVGNLTAYGYDYIGLERQIYERNAQKLVVNTFDTTISVYEDMTEEFNKIYSKNNRNITVDNGFDWDDINLKEASNPPKNKIRMIFCGTLYNKSIHVFKEFLEVLTALKKENKEIYDLLQIDFYGNVPANFHELTKNIEAIAYHGFIPLNDIYYEINDSHICMLFMTDDMNYSLSTKFYEYAVLKKSIAVFTKRGKTGEFIVENGMGYMMEYGRIKSSFIKMVNDIKLNKLKKSHDFDLTPFSISELVKKIDEVLI